MQWLKATFGKASDFRPTPIRRHPLRPTQEDYELFIGREDLGIEFRTMIDCDDGCVCVLSGDIGVGKTSFFNAQQYLLYSDSDAFGPRLVPALELTPLEQDDSPDGLARRVVYNAIKSVEAFCAQQGQKFPNQLKNVRKWMSHKGSSSGIEFGLSILGNGGSIAFSFDAPHVKDATLENWKEVLGVVSSEIVHSMGYDGIFVVLDNAENVDNEHLARLLMSYRDTLFTVKGIWWVLIGQAGLYSLIDAADRRVSQRILGNGLKVPPLSADQLHKAIELRVRRFRFEDAAVSPISRKIHGQLYDASKGEIRFVLNTSDALVRKIASTITNQLFSSEVNREVGAFRSALTQAVGAMLVRRQIPDELAQRVLSKMTYDQMNKLQLKKKELQVLCQIGDNEARGSDHQNYKIKTMQDFSSNYLVKMFAQNLLHRRQAGRAVFYGLRGFAALAHEFALFDELMAKSE